MNKKIIQLDITMDVEFDMKHLMKDLIEDAQKEGCITQNDIEEYIENCNFNVTIFRNNVISPKLKYYNFNYLFESIMDQLELCPLSNENIKLIENILNK